MRIHKKRGRFCSLLIIFLSLTVFSLIFSLFPTPAQAVSMTGGRPSFTYEKGMKTEYSFGVWGAQKIRATLEGSLPNLTKYVTLVDPNPDGGERTLTLKFNMYDDLPPGRYQAVIRAVEMVEQQGTITARTGMKGVVDILVLYPGKYVEWSTSAENLNINETSKISLTVTNLGTEDIGQIRGKIEVFGQSPEIFSTIYTNTKTVQSDRKETITANFDSTGLPKGNYKYNATLFWDDNVSGPKQGSFRIGSLEVFIKEYTKEFFIEAISPLKIIIESDWSGVIQGVYAQVQTPNKLLTTPTTSIEGFRQATLETYWDTRGLGEGVFDSKITVFYSGEKKSEDVKFFVNKTEMPKLKESSFLSNFSTTTIILVIIIIILVANFIFFYFRGMKKNEKQP